MANIRIDQLSDEVNKVLREYSDLATDELKKAIKNAGKTVQSEIRATAPVHTGEYSGKKKQWRKPGAYAKSWTSRVTTESSTGATAIVYSPAHYRLTHLLENGHAKRNGGRTRAFPHIAAAAEKGVEQLERDITRALGGG